VLLSVIIPGKNDNFRKNTTQVLKLNLQQTIENIKQLNNDDVELVLCDWGSEKKILDSIDLEKHKNFKCVYVPPEIAKKYNNGASYSVVHPLNTAFRHTLGKFVIFWDSDCFVSYQSFKEIYNFVKKMDKMNDTSFYWSSRIDVDYKEYESLLGIDELNLYLKNRESVKIDFDPVKGCASSILMNRILWESSTGWWEELPHWGWQDIEYHNRLLQRYEYGGNLNDFGINFYHLTCSEKQNEECYFPPNPQKNSPVFECNGNNWGLNDEVLEII